MWELIIIWNNGDKDIYEYPTEREAKNAEQGTSELYGYEIRWICVRKARS